MEKVHRRAILLMDWMNLCFTGILILKCFSVALPELSIGKLKYRKYTCKNIS